MYLISVYFDDNANVVLNRHIERIAAKTDNTFMTKNKVPPHMTLLSVEARNVEVLIPAIEGLKEKLCPGTIQFVSVGQFLPYVMYATPILNEYLQSMITNVYESVINIPETTVSKYYKPFSWLPHVTLGKTLTKEQLRIAMEVMQENFVPFETKIVEIGLAKVNPHEDVVRYKL